MSRTVPEMVFAAIVTAALTVAPLALSSSAFAQTANQTQAKPKKSPTAGQSAARERLKKCGAEWKEAKAAGKVEAGMKWPKYWSACNKRLKSAG